MSAYYNEHDPFAAQWLRNLIVRGLIAPGEVDERDIQDVKPDDLKGFEQCHFFAGIGGWSYALRLAGVADDEPVWTGSCPCQPFSAAGRQEGKADARHLWPVWSRLIRKCRPARIFGEQVASAIAFGWLDEAAHDLEAEEYAVAAAVLPACSVGAPHRRDRLWFVANAEGSGSSQGGTGTVFAEFVGEGRNGAVADAQCYAGCAKHGNESRQRTAQKSEYDSRLGFGGKISTVADTGSRRCGGAPEGQVQQPWRAEVERAGQVPLADALRNRSATGVSGSHSRNEGDAGIFIDGGHGCVMEHAQCERIQNNRSGKAVESPRGMQSQTHERERLWLDPGESGYVICGDGKRRPVEPRIRLLAHGVPGRVGRLRGYGNAIVPQVAAEFIRAAW